MTEGPYRFVRHPVYLGEFGACAGLVVVAPSLWNLGVAAIFVGAQAIRMRLEELALVAEFPEYAAYAAATPRIVPLLPHPEARSDRDRAGPMTGAAKRRVRGALALLLIGVRRGPAGRAGGRPDDRPRRPLRDRHHDDRGENASLSFDGTAGQRVSLEITDVTIGTSTCCSTRVSILRPDGRSLATVTVGTNGGFLDATALPSAGTYTVLVDPQSTNVGSATLTLHDVPPDATGSVTAGGPAAWSPPSSLVRTLSSLSRGPPAGG